MFKTLQVVQWPAQISDNARGLGVADPPFTGRGVVDGNQEM